jgi:hypothetical protein
VTLERQLAGMLRSANSMLLRQMVVLQSRHDLQDDGSAIIHEAVAALRAESLAVVHVTPVGMTTLADPVRSKF